MPQSPSSPPAADEIDLGRLFGLLLDHKWVIILITALFLLMGIVYAQLQTPIFRADALVQVESKSGVSNPLSDIRAMMDAEPKGDAEIGIIQSRMVLGRTVDQERLDVVVQPRRFPVIGGYLVRSGMERPDSFGQSSVWAGEAINVATLQVEPHLVGRPFTLTVEGDGRYSLSLNDETLGKANVGEDIEFMDGDVLLRIAEIQAGAGAEFTIVKRSRLAAIRDIGSRLNVSMQGKESGMLRLNLTDSNQQRARQTLQTISQTYLTQNVQRQSAEAEKSLEFLEQQTPDVLEKLRQSEDELNKYRMEQDSVDLSMETQSILSRLVNIEAQLNELEFSEAEISRRFTTNHPTYSALLEKKSQLQRERDKINEEINNLPETQQQILRKQRDVEVTQAIYVQLLNRMQEMNIAKASTVGNVRIIDDAVVNPGPVEPKKSLIVMVATLLGLTLSIAMVLVRGLLNKGVEAPDQIESLDLPVYATVPLSEEQQKLTQRIKHKRDRQGKDTISGVLAMRNPVDLSIEALRGLRTSLHFAMLEADNNLLMIVGPSPAIGKSFISVNLAAVCAQAGQKVLVVDADMRKGHIHHAFKGKSEGGLSDILSGKQTLEEVIRDTEIVGLDYISRGMAPPNPSELLMQQSFTNFVNEINHKYDLVIIDTPPILAVTDASIVGKQAGTSLLVARFQVNAPREIELAKRRLETAGVTVKGAILNAMERKAATEYGYGYYNYSYK